MEWATGSGGDRFTTADHEGHLVMFLGRKEEEFEGEYGAQTVARVQLTHCLACDQDYQDALIFGRALAPAVYRPMSEVLGVIGKGEGKGGGNKPWILEEATEAEKDQASKWYAAHIERDGALFKRKKENDPDEAPF